MILHGKMQGLFSLKQNPLLLDLRGQMYRQKKRMQKTNKYKGIEPTRLSPDQVQINSP